jgi:hypothetical protein
MKAERRHELQQNTLAKVLDDLPLYLRFHANKILIAIIVICLIFLLIRHRINAAAEAKNLATESLSAARSGVSQLNQLDQMQPNEVSRLQERKKLIEQVQGAINDVLNNTSDPDDAAARAEAMILRGDLYWEVANLPPIPGATTLPGYAEMPTTMQALSDAESSYRQVLQAYPNRPVAKVSSLFGLAAIEENRGNWDKATEYYNQVNNDTGIAQIYKNFAQSRVALIPQIRNPTHLGAFSSTQPATAPATAEATETATNSPATAPTTNVQ